MRTPDWMRLTLLIVLVIAPQSALALQTSDLLVSYGDEILQVDPSSGQYSVFSSWEPSLPRRGAHPLLDGMLRGLNRSTQHSR